MWLTDTQVVRYPKDMQNPTTIEVIYALNAIDDVIDDLNLVRKHIKEITALKAEMHDTEMRLQTLNQIAEPEDDKHEVLFARLNLARQNLRQIQDSQKYLAVKNLLDIAESRLSVIRQAL